MNNKKKWLKFCDILISRDCLEKVSMFPYLFQVTETGRVLVDFSITIFASKFLSINITHEFWSGNYKDNFV